MQLASPLEQLEHEEPGTVLALVADDLIERFEPLRSLCFIDVGQLMLEFVEIHGAGGSLVRAAPAERAAAGRTVIRIRTGRPAIGP